MYMSRCGLLSNDFFFFVVKLHTCRLQLGAIAKVHRSPVSLTQFVFWRPDRISQKTVLEIFSCGSRHGGTTCQGLLAKNWN